MIEFGGFLKKIRRVFAPLHNRINTDGVPQEGYWEIHVL